MIHEAQAEETVSVFKLLQSGNRVSPADATIHENYFWLRQMADHLSFISHYLDTSNDELHDEVRKMTKNSKTYFSKPMHLER